MKLNVEYGVIIGIMEDKTNCKKEIERVGGGNQEEYFQSESNKIDGLKMFNNFFKAKNNGKCPFCKKDTSPQASWTELEKKEFKISGMCAVCQRDFFK